MHFLVVVWFCGFGAFLAANQRHYYYLESNNNNNIVVPYGLESTVFPYIRTFYVHTKVWFFFLLLGILLKSKSTFSNKFSIAIGFFYFNNALDVRKTSKGLFLTDLWQFFQFFSTNSIIMKKKTANELFSSSSKIVL